MSNQCYGGGRNNITDGGHLPEQASYLLQVERPSRTPLRCALLRGHPSQAPWNPQRAHIACKSSLLAPNVSLALTPVSLQGRETPRSINSPRADGTRVDNTCGAVLTFTRLRLAEQLALGWARARVRAIVEQVPHGSELSRQVSFLLLRRRQGLHQGLVLSDMGRQGVLRSTPKLARADHAALVPLLRVHGGVFSAGVVHNRRRGSPLLGLQEGGRSKISRKTGRFFDTVAHVTTSRWDASHVNFADCAHVAGRSTSPGGRQHHFLQSSCCARATLRHNTQRTHTCTCTADTSQDTKPDPIIAPTGSASPPTRNSPTISSPKPSPSQAKGYVPMSTFEFSPSQARESSASESSATLPSPSARLLPNLEFASCSKRARNPRFRSGSPTPRRCGSSFLSVRAMSSLKAPSSPKN